MDIHEYQAKRLLAQHSVPVPKGIVVANLAEVEEAVAELGGRAVIKAQVHAGGRGKGGGVKLVKSAEEATAFAKKLLGSRLVTPQTGADGTPVERVLVEAVLDIERELYLSVLIDNEVGLPLILASGMGGMDIEQVSAENPDALLFVHGDPLMGFSNYKLRRLAHQLGLAGDAYKSMVRLLGSLCAMSERLDCAMIEINPLILTKTGEVYAGDAKLKLDDDALPRHPELIELRDPGQLNELERRATEADLAYVKLDNGKVGCMVNGAGLAMATMDMTLRAGAVPANFLDIGGSAQQEHIEKAFKIVADDADVEAVLLNLFAGIARADVVARGIVEAVRATGTQLPIVAVIRGTNAAEGIRIFKDSGVRCTIVGDLTAAAIELKSILGND